MNLKINRIIEGWEYEESKMPEHLSKRISEILEKICSQVDTKPLPPTISTLIGKQWFFAWSNKSEYLSIDIPADGPIYCYESNHKNKRSGEEFDNVPDFFIKKILEFKQDTKEED
jgi:hypothetical protein